MKLFSGATHNNSELPQVVENAAPAEDFELHRAFVPEGSSLGFGLNNTDSSEVVAEQATSFLAEMGLKDLVCSVKDSGLMTVHYPEGRHTYLLADYRSGSGWTFTRGTYYLIQGSQTYNGSFSFPEFRKIIQKELAFIRKQLPEEHVGEAPSFFMMQIRRQTRLRQNEWFSYVGHDLSWQQILLFGEAYVPVDKIEEAKLLPEEWVKEIFTPQWVVRYRKKS